MNKIFGKLFKKTKYIQLKPEALQRSTNAATFNFTSQVPEGLYHKCKKCGAMQDREIQEEKQGVCIKCGYHSRLVPMDRLKTLIDHNSFTPLFENVIGSNPLDFPNYTSKVDAERLKTSRTEAILTGTASIGGYACAIGVMDSSFMMGSMGVAVGERITQLIELSETEHLPLIILTASGGARMQEGIFSLMQMAKTSIALSQLSRAGGLYVSVLTDPTTGGVTASFAMLGDIILAEPGALIGFAGPRVIEQTIRQKLPDGFQTSEFLLEHGFIDKIVPREQLQKTISQIIRIHGGKRYEV